MLAELESFNEPAKKSVLTESFEVGNMAVIRQDKRVRIGEIVEVSDDTIKLQWYGTTTNKDLARYRWKFYPGWETKDGEVEFKKTQVGGDPAMCVFENAMLGRYSASHEVWSESYSSVFEEVANETEGVCSPRKGRNGLSYGYAPV